MMRTAIVMLATLVACSAYAIGATPTDPRTSIRATVDSLVAVIQEGKTYFDNDPERFYHAVQQVLDPAIDFDTFARGVMAVHYKRATPAQRERFQATFKTGLIRTYGKALLSFGDEKITVLPAERPPTQPDRDSVKTEIFSKEGKIYPVIYSMRLGKDGAWRVYNLTVNGINLGLTYRNQFTSSMKAPATRGNLDAVIDAWGETIANVDPSAEGTAVEEGADAATGAGD
jgi:phospholipid transport system substrate-binding protein